MIAEHLDLWALTELPRLNQAVLTEVAPPTVVVDALRAATADLPEPEGIPPLRARQLVVHLGLAGASVARHSQESDAACRADPPRCFDPVRVGPGQIPFRDYFARLADRTGTGHCHRDTYASLVRWNVDTTEIRWNGQVLGVLPGVFDDGRVRTYTGDPGEERFFELVKFGEAIELGINAVLLPITEDQVGPHSDEAVQRVRVATALLHALRRLFRDFAALPPERGMSPEHFMDTFRQFAVHWVPDDIPPSGALDPEALKRDFLLGLSMPGYVDHVNRLFPALLDNERAELAQLMRQPALPMRLLGGLGLTADMLHHLPRSALLEVLTEHPAIGQWYLLLTAHARAAGAHLQLSKKFLFKPQQEREDAGLGDPSVVSNRRGTTGMDESLLERLTRIRRDHVLAGLHRIPAPTLMEIVSATSGPPLDPDGTSVLASPAAHHSSEVTLR